MKLQTGRRSAEKSDLTQAGLSEGACCMPLFTMPSKEGHAGPFEVPDHPCRQPQNLPPLNFYAIGQKLLNIYSPIDVCVFFFEGERLQETFLCLTQLRRERSQTVPCFVSLPFLL